MAKGRGHCVILFSTVITTIVLRSSAKFLAGGRWCWLIMAGGGWWWLVMAGDEWWWLIMAGGNV